MRRVVGAQHAFPLAVLVSAVVLDLAIGPDQVVLGLVAIAPLVASTALGRRATGAHALVALAAAALLGVYDEQYTEAALGAQAGRLVAVALAGVVAVGASTLRLRREAELARLSAEAAVTQVVVQTAETLQRHLLGPAPRVPGLETAVRYSPAGRHTEVGGDWYDAFPAPDGTTWLVIGDVAGHDAPAAAAMAQVRGMLRALAHAGPRSPAAVLRALDDVLAGSELPTLVTATVAAVNTRRTTGEPVLRWSCAGHPPPVLVRADGGAQLLERPPDPLLGLEPGLPRTDHEVPFGPGDTLLLYTDGLVERRGAPLDDGLAWLVDEVARQAREPVDRLCDALLAEIGGRVGDDVALLAVRMPAKPGSTAR